MLNEIMSWLMRDVSHTRLDVSGDVAMNMKEMFGDWLLLRICTTLYSLIYSSRISSPISTECKLEHLEPCERNKCPWVLGVWLHL